MRNLKAFILLALQPVDLRPTASELLLHPFLNPQRDHPKDHEKVSLVEEPIPIELSLECKGSRVRVQFLYDPAVDTPFAVAAELAKELKLPTVFCESLRLLIQEKLESDQVTSGDSSHSNSHIADPYNLHKQTQKLTQGLSTLEDAL